MAAVGASHLRHSIIRRSTAVMAAFGIGHAFNYALLWAANHLLDTGGFGLFYTSVLIINILFSPIMGIMLVLTRGFADAGARQGRAQVVAMTWRLLGICGRALPLVFLISALLAIAVGWLGLQAWPVALLIPLAVTALVATEILRTSFQGMLLFGWQNAVWVTSNAAQFTGAVGALWLMPRVWPGIAGILAGAIITFLLFIPWFLRERRTGPIRLTPELTFHLGQELPTIIGYSLFILLNNVDILIGYWLLPRSALDVYAASSLLPKAIVTATFAVAQVVLPVIVEQRADGVSCRQAAMKAFAMVMGLGAAGAVALWVIVPWLQATPFAIHGLSLPIMMTLALGGVALSAIRVLIVVEIALRRYTVGLAQAGAILLFAAWCLLSSPAPLRIAELYALIAWVFLAAITLAWLTSARLPTRPLLSRLFQSAAQ